MPGTLKPRDQLPWESNPAASPWPWCLLLPLPVAAALLIDCCPVQPGFVELNAPS